MEALWKRTYGQEAFQCGPLAQAPATQFALLCYSSEYDGPAGIKPVLKRGNSRPGILIGSDIGREISEPKNRQDFLRPTLA
jgi:hypothetical protein